MAYAPGDEVYDWTTQDGKQINGVLMNLHIQQPLEVALDGLKLAETYIYRAGGTLGVPADLSGPGGAVGYDTAIRDTLGGWDSGSPSQVTVPQTGFYMVSASATYGLTTSGNSWVRVQRNGTRVGAQGSVALNNTAPSTATATAFLLCNAGDVITAAAASSGSSVILGASSTAMSNRSETNLIVVYLGS